MSNAGKLKTAVFVLLALSFLGTAAFYISGHLPSKASLPPRAVGGVLDLRNWSFGQNGVLSLEGQWEFYWRQLLNPEDFKGGGAVPRAGYIEVPGTWNGYALPGNGKGQKLPGEGYATYRLVIHTNADEPVLGLKILDFATSYRLWVNGELLSENGRVGTNKDETLPQSFPRLVNFQNDGGTVEIVLQIANFTHRKGGIWTDIKIGTPGQLQTLREKQAFGTLFLCGGLLIMAVYHLGLYLLRRKDRAPLFCALLCFLIAARQALQARFSF
ncbi:MAG: hypothetical protein AB1796_14965 [Bacillota bacterium]